DDRRVRANRHALALHLDADALAIWIAGPTLNRDEVPRGQLGLEPFEDAGARSDAAKQRSAGAVGHDFDDLRLERPVHQREDRLTGRHVPNILLTVPVDGDDINARASGRGQMADFLEN